MPQLMQVNACSIGVERLRCERFCRANCLVYPTGFGVLIKKPATDIPWLVEIDATRSASTQVCSAGVVGRARRLQENLFQLTKMPRAGNTHG